jgi:hypothetical protein
MTTNLQAKTEGGEMKIIVFLTLVAASLGCKAQSAEGSMDCTVTGNVVVASEEGKFKTYSGMEGGVKVNEKVKLNYRVSSNSIYIGLERNVKEKNIIINQYLSTDDSETTSENANGGFVIESSTYDHSISFQPDYIRISGFRELVLSRYYKNDWHGIYSFVMTPDPITQTITLDCRSNKDNMDKAFKLFTGNKKPK